MIAHRPDDVSIPDLVLEVADGRPLLPVWVNEMGGLTFETGAGDDRQFLKWSAHGVDHALSQEAARLRWVAAYDTVPVVVGLYEDHLGEVLATRR